VLISARAGEGELNVLQLLAAEGMSQKVVSKALAAHPL
jgi:hypothetical protein